MRASPFRHLGGKASTWARSADFPLLDNIEAYVLVPVGRLHDKRPVVFGTLGGTMAGFLFLTFALSRVRV